MDNPETDEYDANDEDYDEDDSYDNDEFDIEDYMDEDDIPSYKLNANNTGPDDEHKQVPFASIVSFHEHLISQLNLRVMNEKENHIAMHIIGNLDDSGYLQRDITSMIDDLAFSQNIVTDKEELMRMLDIIQDLDPPGVGARNLQECLLIQIKRKDPDLKTSLKNAYHIIDRYFNEFTKKHYDKILKKTGISEEDLKDVINEILKLNPKPGSSLNDNARTNQYIIPDFIITNNDGELELNLNSKNTPELRLNKLYTEMLENFAANKAKGKNGSKEKEAFMFIKQKIDSAKWFIDAIKQRQHTLYITMKTIMEYQKNYFLEGDETMLKPMILKDIAEIVNLDISTISRVANSKYVQTPFGTFLLKSFFSESMQTESGEEVSTREVKKILLNCVNSENKSKPYTDEELANILKEKGYNIARRTVAKYREQLNISVARLRKEL